MNLMNCMTFERVKRMLERIHSRGDVYTMEVDLMCENRHHRGFEHQVTVKIYVYINSPIHMFNARPTGGGVPVNSQSRPKFL